jgi:hypothetical protein
MAKRITELSSKVGDMSSSDVFMTDNGTVTTKIDYNALAAEIITQYAGSTLAGNAQSAKAAIDGLKVSLDNVNRGKSTLNGTNCSVTVAGSTALLKVLASGVEVASATSNIVIGTLPEGFRVAGESIYFPIVAATSGYNPTGAVGWARVQNNNENITARVSETGTFTLIGTLTISVNQLAQS